MALLTKDRAPRTAPIEVMVAAATKVDLTAKREVDKAVKRSEKWQEEAWAYFDAIGEIKYAQQLIANGISKIRLFAAVQLEPDQPPVPIGEAVNPGDDPDREPDWRPTGTLARAAEEELARLRAPDGGQSEILRELAINLRVVGEAYLVGRTDEPVERWNVYSESEVVKGDREGEVKIVPEPGKEGETLPTDAFLARIWRRHPRWSDKADSNMRAVLDACEELLILSRSIRAAGLSRLSAGFLLIEEGITIGGPDDEAEDDDPKRDPFMARLMDGMLAPIGDEGHPAAQVPIVLKGKEVKDKVSHMTVDRPIDAQTIERCRFLLTRIAQGLDFPPEILTGMADVNHWTAWQIEESTFKAHMEPDVVLMVDALATRVLRPLLGARSEEFDQAEIDRVVIGYDPTRLVARPNRGEDAKALHAAAVLSDSKLRDVHGFSDADAPDEEEILRRMTLNKSILTADISGALLKAFFDAMSQVALPTAVTGEDQPAPGELPPAPEDTDDRDIPDDEQPDGGPPAQAAARPALTAAAAGNPAAPLGQVFAALDSTLMTRLLAACDAAIDRALDRAGTRVTGKAAKNKAAAAAVRDVPLHLRVSTLGPSMVAALSLTSDEMLEGAFDSLRERWDQWVARGQAEALAAVQAAVDVPPAAVAETETAQQHDRDDGWTVLLAGLLVLARQRLFDPSPAAPVDGEFDATVSVPPAIVRDALARAGGETIVDLAARPPGGVATGARLRELLVEAGVITAGYRWVYGDSFTRTRPFEPHRVLSGLEFPSWDDPMLETPFTASWLGRSLMRPGDHRGCQCNFEPVLRISGQEV